MKTADEMFRELGYEIYKSPPWAVSYYRNKDNRNIFLDMAGRTISVFMHGVRTHMEYNEILACAQLIREMEVNT